MYQSFYSLSGTPFTREEVSGYIRHHMELAGAKHHIFTDAAIEALSTLTGG